MLLILTTACSVPSTLFNLGLTSELATIIMVMGIATTSSIIGGIDSAINWSGMASLDINAIRSMLRLRTACRWDLDA